MSLTEVTDVLLWMHSWNIWKHWLGCCSSLHTSWNHKLHNNYQRRGATSEQATKLPNYFIENSLVNPTSFLFQVVLVSVYVGAVIRKDHCSWWRTHKSFPFQSCFSPFSIRRKVTLTCRGTCSNMLVLSLFQSPSPLDKELWHGELIGIHIVKNHIVTAKEKQYLEYLEYL
jgi:hypothetical protein